MNLGEIRQECWDTAAELAGEDMLWPEEEINRLINRVYWNIASVTKCIRDSRTPAVCLISSTPVDYTTLTEGTFDYLLANDTASWLYHQNVAPYLYPLHASILSVEEVKWLSRGFMLRKVSSHKWMELAQWEQVLGIPTEYALDLERGKLAVNYRDQVADTLKLSVRRLPLVPLQDTDDEPEFHQDYHASIIPGVLELMFAKKDSEAYDPEKSISYAGKYSYELERIKREELRWDRRLNPNQTMRAFR